MDVFKQLTVVRRRNDRSGSIVSDDDDSDISYGDSKALIVENSNDFTDGRALSLYGRRRSADHLAESSAPSKMAVVTSSKFDSDEIFSVAARAMIDRYQNENMSEREAILGTLGDSDDLRAFIEALDLRYIVFTSQNKNEMESSGDDTLSEIVIQTKSIFNTTLREMWRGEETASLPFEMTGEDGVGKHREEIITTDDDYRQQHPKTPKNLRMSPMRTSSFNYKNHGFISQSESIDSACSEGSNGSMFRPFKRPRRWFFPQNKAESSVTPLFKSTVAKIAPNNKSGSIKPAFPKFHFNLGKINTIDNNTSNKNSILFGDLRTGSTSVPPMSPIRKVSVEMQTDGNTAKGMS